MTNWCLEGKFDPGQELARLSLSVSPFVIGRDSEADLSILSPGVSRRHAQFELIDDCPVVSDLGSTNGTFVNHQRIDSPVRVGHGDLVHLAELEILVLNPDLAEASHEHEADSDATMVFTEVSLGHTVVEGADELRQLIDTCSLNMHFQPIMSGRSKSLYGYEVLGRGCYPGLANDPMSLFSLAEKLELEIELSSLMRKRGIEIAAEHNLPGHIFINTHPSEMKDADVLLASLRELRSRFPKLSIVFEVHEHAVAGIDSLKCFKAELKKMNIRFAFDDFGVGQSRLLELLEAQPDIVKFDRSLIANIDKAENKRKNLLYRLIEFSTDNNIEPLAEGVETAEEYKTCEHLGFELYQGYFFSRPMPIDSIK